MDNEPKPNPDTQFQGFAELSFGELARATSFDQMQLLIARHAYTLVRHAVEHIDPKHLDVLGLEETVQRIPDLTSWNGEQK